MRAGGLRKYRIEIQRSSESENRFGEREKIWETAVETKADVISKSGTRINDVHELTPFYSVDFRIRQYHEVDEKMRVIFNGKKYRILAIPPITDKQMKTLICELINE